MSQSFPYGVGLAVRMCSSCSAIAFLSVQSVGLQAGVNIGVVHSEGDLLRFPWETGELVRCSECFFQTKQFVLVVCRYFIVLIFLKHIEEYRKTFFFFFACLLL